MQNNLCFYCSKEGHSIAGCKDPDKKIPHNTIQTVQQIFPIQEKEMDPTDIPSFVDSPL